MLPERIGSNVFPLISGGKVVLTRPGPRGLMQEHATHPLTLRGKRYILQSKTGLTIVALLRRRGEERTAAGPIFHLCPGAVTIFPRGRQSGMGKRERGRRTDGRCSIKSRENWCLPRPYFLLGCLRGHPDLGPIVLACIANANQENPS